ncbi:MAG: FecR family protein, partial [Planctomycetota bacterium]
MQWFKNALGVVLIFGLIAPVWGEEGPEESLPPEEAAPAAPEEGEGEHAPPPVDPGGEEGPEPGAESPSPDGDGEAPEPAVAEEGASPPEPAPPDEGEKGPEPAAAGEGEKAPDAEAPANGKASEGVDLDLGEGGSAQLQFADGTSVMILQNSKAKVSREKKGEISWSFLSFEEGVFQGEGQSGPLEYILPGLK